MKLTPPHFFHLNPMRHDASMFSCDSHAGHDLAGHCQQLSELRESPFSVLGPRCFD